MQATAQCGVPLEVLENALREKGYTTGHSPQSKPLAQMGATIQLYRECLGSLPCRFQQRNYKHSAVIFGPTPLTGRDIDVPDLRGGFSHLIAALAAKGPSDVRGISLIDRGYADFRGKLEALGADFD